MTGGARVLHQDLHPHLTELNHSLLTLGCVYILETWSFEKLITLRPQRSEPNAPRCVLRSHRH